MFARFISTSRRHLIIGKRLKRNTLRVDFAQISEYILHLYCRRIASNMAQTLFLPLYRSS